MKRVEPRPKPLALIVEDIEIERKGLLPLLEKAGFEVHAADDYSSAATWLNKQGDRLDLLVVDLKLREPNLGWRVITEAKSFVPHWCRIVVLTAYPETRPAAKAAGVRFIEKGTREFAYDFLPMASEWGKARQNQLDAIDDAGPEVDTRRLEDALHYEELMMCRAIADAQRVEVIRRLKGSLQQGTTVLQIWLTPKGEAPYCFAVVKRASVKKADDEVAGQAKLMWYWEKIGRSLPPLRRYPSLLSSQERVLVTPFARGRTLAEVAADNWYHDTQGRVNTFVSIFDRVVGFLEIVNRPRKCKHGALDTFKKAYLAETPKAADRKTRAIPVLDSIIASDAPTLRCVRSSVTVLNPLLLFKENRGGIGWEWPHAETTCGVVTYGHGDFHVGNVMVNLNKKSTLDSNSLTVLDYDYVDEYCRYYDTAQLESSFLLELALAFDQECGPAMWDKYYLPALKVLTAVESDDSIKNNEFASDLVHVIRKLRGTLSPPDLQLYYGALLTTLLRISVSKHRMLGGELPISARRTVVVTLGLLLNQLGEAEGPFDELPCGDVDY